MILFYRAVGKLIEIIEFCILIRILMSFLGIYDRNIITNLLYEITEPILSISRKILDKLGIDTGMLDFSPLIALLIMRVFYVLLGSVLF